MIYWNEYKQYKVLAEKFIKEESSRNLDIEIEVLKLKTRRITQDEAIENIINIISNGEHFKPLK
jgi:hypothetical protein